MIFLPKFKYSFSYIRSIRTSHSFRATPKIGNIEFREIFAIQILFPSFFFLFALKFSRDISPRSFSDDDRRPHLCRNKRIVRAGNVECIVYLYITFGKDCCHILHRIYSSRIIIFGKNCVRQTFGPCLNLEASRCRWCECVKNCVLRLTYSLSYRSCTIHRNAVCMCVGVWVCVCGCISVEKKKFPDQRRPFWGTFLRKPSRIDYFSPKFCLSRRWDYRREGGGVVYKGDHQRPGVHR